MRRCSVAVGVAAAVGLAVAGCGPGAGRSNVDVEMIVTRDFGAAPVARIGPSRVSGDETVMQLLERHLRVGARYSNDFVESIDGLSGTAAHRDWFYYVNGSEASSGAGTTAVHSGDRIWWDLHDWTETYSIPAVVGSYPAPFVDGDAPRRRTVLSCAADVPAACQAAVRALTAVGAVLVRRTLRAGPGGSADAAPGRPAVLVGTERDLAGDPAGRLIASGPKASGVYVRFGTGGATLQLLDPQGARIATLAAGAGLVAATAVSGGPATWVLTGTDPAGVAAAAGALLPDRLHDAFALAVVDGRSLPVPRDPSR